MEKIIIILSILTSITSVIIVIVLFYFLQKKFKNNRANLVNKLGVQPINVNNFSGVIDDLNYHIRISPRSKNKPEECYIIIDNSTAAPFRISFLREKIFHKFVKAIKLSNELQTNNQTFDELVYVSTNNTQSAKSLISNMQLQNQVINLFQNNNDLQKISFKEKSIELLLSPCRFEDISKEKLTEILHSIKNIRSIVNSTIKISENNSLNKDIITCVCAGVYLIFSIVMFAIGISNYETFSVKPYFIGLIFGVIISALLILVVYHILRGNSYSHIPFFICFGILLISFAFAGIGGLLYLNGKLDDSPAIKNTVKIIDKYSQTHRSKNSTTTNYYIKFNYWGDDNKDYNFKIDRDFYKQINVNDRITFITHNGFWNYEWIEKYYKE